MNSRLTGVVVCVLAAPAISRGAITTYSSLASFQAVVGPAPVLEDFESAGPANTPIPSLSSPVGVFQGLAGVPFPNVFVQTTVPPSARLTANGQEDILWTLATPSTAFGFDTLVNGLGPVTIRVFGAGGVELGTAFEDHDPSVLQFFGVVADEPIASVRFTASHGEVLDTGFDNVRLPTPGAGVVALLGSVLAARRRRV